MIAKIIRHADFVEPCFYALKGDLKRPEVLAANGVRMSSASEMAADFELQRSLRPGLRQAVEHIALAWPPGETDKLTNNEVMVRAAMLYLEKRGIDPATTQWALVRHHDQEHPHCHLILNRVTDDGQVVPDKHSYRVSAVACRKVEAAMGFVDAAQLGAAAKLREAEQGKLPADVAERVQCKDLIRRALEKHLPTATTVRELQEALATEGVRMKATLQQGGQLQAVVFEVAAYPGLHVKGSEVAREYSGVGLRKTLEAQAEHREATAAIAQLRPQPAVPVVPEPAAALPSTQLASATSRESHLPVVSHHATVTPTGGRVEPAMVSMEVDKKLPNVPVPVLIPEVTLPAAVVVAGLSVDLKEATEPTAGRSPLGRVVLADPPADVASVEAVAQQSRPALDLPEAGRQAELLRQVAAQQATVTVDALAGIRREWVCIALLVQQADQAERACDYARVADLRYGLIQEAELRIGAHEKQANATPAGRVLLNEMHAQEQERIRVAAQVEAAEQQRREQQRTAEDARQRAEAIQIEAQRRENAAIAAFQQAHQQVAEYRTQTDAAKKGGDYALVGILRGIITSAEGHVQRCETELRKTLSVADYLVQVEAQKKVQQEQAHAKYEREQLADLESFRGRWPYSGTHIRLQVPVEYLPTVSGAIRRHNHTEYELQEHADKTTSPRVVDGKVAVNILYETKENAAKLDDALREFRKNGVEVFEQPADRTSREERAADTRLFERQYAEKLSRSNAFPEIERSSPRQIEM